MARVAREVADPGPMLGLREPSDDEVVATRRDIAREAASVDAVWFFAFGSLIWKPACDFVEQRVALAHGWHRAFCLGWDTRYRGNNRAGLASALGHLGEIDEARRVWAELKEVNPRYSFAERIARLPFSNPAHPAKIAEGLAKAGLPD